MAFRRIFIYPSLAALGLLISACASAPSETDRPPLPEPDLEGETAEPDPQVEQEIASPPSPKPEIIVPEDFAFPKSLSLCPRMTISNAPPANAEGEIATYATMAALHGVRLAVAPIEAGCFSSGFGPRNGRPHKGSDLYNPDPVAIYAATDGWIREKVYREDYGNMLVIQHGDTVFARYAHLESFADNIEIGDTVRIGQTIGIMGETGRGQVPRHLHYEVLTGEWGVLTGSFGLTPVDIFAHIPTN